MIVVCGDLGGPETRGTSAFEVARQAAALGATVQVVGVVADDRGGDRRLLQLTTAGIGHAAVLRGPARPLEPADVDLALRYLADVRVVVALGLPGPVLAAAAERADWAGASLIVVGGAASGPAADQPDVPGAAIVLEPPANDPEGAFAGFVGGFAARLEAGAKLADAWSATVRELAVDPA